MTTVRKRFDMSAPGAHELARRIRQGAFVSEGTMVAFPTCFPGVTTPIVSDEGRITALDLAPDFSIYGGTSGRQAHVFMAALLGVTGMVFDLGAVEGADECVAVCCGKTSFVAFFNGPSGGRVVTSEFPRVPAGLIQEWTFEKPALDEIGCLGPKERILHALALPDRAVAIGITDRRLFSIDFETRTTSTIEEMEGRGNLAAFASGRAYGLDKDRTLWRYDARTAELALQAVSLPEEGDWSGTAASWARDPRGDLHYLADNKGRLFTFREPGEFQGPLGQTRLSPAGPMAVTHDGRVFGFCGPEISRMFVYEPEASEIRDLGVAVSMIQRRRYGYRFGAAVTGRDGQIIFGEDDDGGHLWLYFPRIRGV